MYFSKTLKEKIHSISSQLPKRNLGGIEFGSPLIMAPLAGITNAPFRLLMQDLLAGGSVSELISCHGINFKNDKTLQMMFVDPREKATGIQLFGEDVAALCEAAKVAEGMGAKFIDLNMGCPVRKVVTKGAGSALMQNCTILPNLFSSIKKSVKIPFTIKIRLGWDHTNQNAGEVIHIATNEGVSWVAIHGRTRAQGYTGKANWEMIEELAQSAKIPIIGNGDLFHPEIIKYRLTHSKCAAFMLGRGPLRDPFLFVKSFATSDLQFYPSDYYEVAYAFSKYLNEIIKRDRVREIELKKLIVWMAAGFPHAAHFRGEVFKQEGEVALLKLCENYFLKTLFPDTVKKINYDDGFMSGGHG